MTCYDCGSPGTIVLEGENPQRTRCQRCHRLKLDWMEDRGMVEKKEETVILPSDPLARAITNINRARQDRQELRDRVRDLKKEVQQLRDENTRLRETHRMLPPTSQRVADQIDIELEKLRVVTESMRRAALLPSPSTVRGDWSGTGEEKAHEARGN